MRPKLLCFLIFVGCIERTATEDCNDCPDGVCIDAVCVAADGGDASLDSAVSDARIGPLEDAMMSDGAVGDARLIDASPPDASPPDASPPDAFASDADLLDAQIIDAASPDRGIPDATPVDAEPECEIHPLGERCDGVDNDCDERVDESEAGSPPCGVESLAVGAHHVCAVLNSGQLKCWGSNLAGQLGHFTEALGDDPGEMGATLPDVELFGRRAVSVAGKERTVCAVLDDGAVACWGYSLGGVLGPQRGSRPRIIDIGGPAIQVAAGDEFACALLEGGGVKCWGNNRYGQLGLGDRDNRGQAPGDLGEALPLVDLGADAVAVAAAREWACAVLDDERVKCWGRGFSGGGTFGDQPGEMGEDLPAIALPPGRTVLQLSMDWTFACALLDDGRVRCWGVEGYGQLGRPRIQPAPDVWPAVDLGEALQATAIATGDGHTCAIIDGGIKCWGANWRGQLGQPDITEVGLDPTEMGDALPFVDLGPDAVAVDIAAGGWATCARFEGGQIRCWGTNEHAQMGQGEGILQPGYHLEDLGENLPAVDLGEGRRATALAAGYGTTCALLEGGDMKCWGGNLDGQLGQGHRYGRGDDHGEMGDALPPIDLGDDVRVERMWTGPRTCVTLAGGALKCWGENRRGYLGLGDRESRGDDPGEMRALPVLDLGSPVVDVAQNTSQTCAVLANGQVKCWGFIPVGGAAETLGDEPGEVGPDLAAYDLGGPARRISAGFRRMCVILQDEGVICWGENQDGQLGLGDTVHRLRPDPNMRVDLGAGRTVVSIVMGYSHNCALLDNQQVKCWGHNFSGQLGQGDTDTRGDEPGEMGDALPPVDLGEGLFATALAAGDSYTCALLNTAQVKCWGSFPHENLGGNLGRGRGHGGQPGDMGDALQPTDLGPGRVVEIATGYDHACVRFEDGRVKCWGQNNFGQLGLGGLTAIGDDPGEMGAGLRPVDLGPLDD